MSDKITLKVHTSQKLKDDRRVVRINAAANAVLMKLYRATGLPLEHIVSQMIIQGAELVEIIEDYEEDI
ncbi:MAG: hypothetical protein HFE63_11095 [Clostridiales bacterium]|nr:hypothetical protein [Clostridiales bacterium]